MVKQGISKLWVIKEHRYYHQHLPNKSIQVKKNQQMIHINQIYFHLGLH